MDNLRTNIKRFALDTSGATAIEYGLIAALIGVACVLAFSSVGNALNSLFGDGSDGVSGAVNDADANFGS